MDRASITLTRAARNRIFGKKSQLLHITEAQKPRQPDILVYFRTFWATLQLLYSFIYHLITVLTKPPNRTRDLGLLRADLGEIIVDDVTSQ